MFRRTLRTQLTLLYAGPFLVSGALLLTIPILSVRESSPVDPSRIGPSRIPPADGVAEPLLTASGVGLAAMGIVSLIIGWFIAGRFLRPLRTITAAARDISASNLHRRLGRTGRGDEFTDLADTLDDLFARLEASFVAQRRFVANASHELRTPLTAERALLQVALADPDATVESLRTACTEVLELGAAQERLIEALLTLATSEQGVEHRVPFDLAVVADRVVRSRHDEARRREVRVDTSLAAAPVLGDPSLAESLVANLVDNALRHNVTAGRVEIVTATVDGRARITVRNTGVAIPSEEVDRLFEPFQRLDRRRVRHTDGHGLGLAIVRAIASGHGANLSPGARADGGLDIAVTFPRSSGRP
jgi:signal transduction histidine kinase